MKRFVCPICHKSFKNQHLLDVHEATHVPTPPPVPAPPPIPDPVPPDPPPAPDPPPVIPATIKRLLAVTVNYPDHPMTETTEQAILAEVERFFLENSYGTYDLQWVYEGVLTTGLSINADSRDIIKSLAFSHNLDEYDYLVLFPAVLGYRSPTFTTPSGHVLDMQYVYPYIAPVLHEMGHMIGNRKLLEASLLMCGDVPIKTDFVTSCQIVQYRDMFTVMGGGSYNLSGHLSAHEKDFLRFFPTGTLLEVTEGTYTLAPYETVGGVKAIKIRRDADSWIYVEYRRPIGYDAEFGNLESRWPGISKLYEGALIHINRPGWGGDGLAYGMSILVPSKPCTVESVGAEWPVGSTYADPCGVVVEVVSRADEALTVRVGKTGIR